MSEGKDTDEGKGSPEQEEEEGEAKIGPFDWMPEGCIPLADGEYDAIVMGTGLKECILSGLLATAGMKVLHVDRNAYYGGDSASLNLTNLFGKFNKGAEPPKDFFDTLGHNRDYNVDLIPKCIMACGKLVKMLLHTKVTRYLEFKSLDASYVYKNSTSMFSGGKSEGKVYKVPATPKEALASSLMGLFEKRRFRSFLEYLAQYDAEKPETFKGRDLNTMTMAQLYEAFSLEPATQQFVGHAMALQTDDSYLTLPALAPVLAIQLYCYSLDRYGKSPFIYPCYGLGGLPEGFSRLCAINGGTFMLNRGVDEVLFDDDGVAWGIKGGNEVAKATMLLGDPSYFAKYNKCKVVGKVVRSICIMDHPIKGTSDVESVQIIIPANEVGRKNDVYVVMVSFAHMVAAKGKYIAIVSTTVETENPLQEVQPGIDLLGPVIARFNDVTALQEPLGDGTDDRCFISASYDATSHFETTSDDVLDLYKRVTGTPLDMNINADSVSPDY